MTEDMLEHYNYIIDIKLNELADLYDTVKYREQELKQLKETLEQMMNILKAPL